MKERKSVNCLWGRTSGKGKDISHFTYKTAASYSSFTFSHLSKIFLDRLSQSLHYPFHVQGDQGFLFPLSFKICFSIHLNKQSLWRHYRYHWHSGTEAEAICSGIRLCVANIQCPGCTSCKTHKEDGVWILESLSNFTFFSHPTWMSLFWIVWASFLFLHKTYLHTENNW